MNILTVLVSFLAVTVLPVVNANPQPVRQDGIYNYCLRDEASPTTYVLFNDQTGQFAYFCAGVPEASGTGAMIRFGTMGWLSQQKGDRIVRLMWDSSGNGTGSAYVTHSGVASCWISDSNMSDNQCSP